MNFGLPVQRFATALAADGGIASAAGIAVRALPRSALHYLTKQAYQTCNIRDPKQSKAPREQDPKCAQDEAVNSLLFFILQTMAPHKTGNTCPRPIANSSNPYIQSPCLRALGSTL